MYALRRVLFSSPKMLTCSKHTLPNLTYEHKALEPVISCETMMIHHTIHHQAYVNNYNAAEEQLKAAVAKSDIGKIVSLATQLRYNGGGHINHTIFWQNLTPIQTQLSEKLCKEMDKAFGGFEAFKKQMTAVSTAVVGNGWGWLGYNKGTKLLQLAACSNQDPLEPTTGLIPLLGFDVGEHAYYLQYKNLRQKYVEAMFDIVNWKDVSDRLAAASC